MDGMQCTSYHVCFCVPGQAFAGVRYSVPVGLTLVIATAIERPCAAMVDQINIRGDAGLSPTYRPVSPLLTLTAMSSQMPQCSADMKKMRKGQSQRSRSASQGREYDVDLEDVLSAINEHNGLPSRKVCVLL